MKIKRNPHKSLILLLIAGILLTMSPTPAAAATVKIPYTDDYYKDDTYVYEGAKGKIEIPSSYDTYSDTYQVESASFTSNKPEIVSVTKSKGTFQARSAGKAKITMTLHCSKTVTIPDEEPEDRDLDEDQDSYEDDSDYEDSSYYDDENDYSDDSDYTDYTDYTDYDNDYYMSSTPLYGDHTKVETKDFKVSYLIYVRPSFKKARLEKTSLTGYIADDGNSSYWWDSSMPTYKVNILSDYKIKSYDRLVDYSVKSSNKKIYVDYSIRNNVLTLRPSDLGTTTVTVKLNKKVLKLTLSTQKVSISDSWSVLAPKLTKQLRLSGASGSVTWTSTNPSVASVSSNGLVVGKATGNTVIVAKLGDSCKVGCAISVVSDSKRRAVYRAMEIAKGTYSQANRMKSGYYDCSSLVWRAYSPYGVNFGVSSYAPTAAGIGQWCSDRKRLVPGGTSYKNIEDMKIQAGDLIFKTGQNNGRFRGIYHVEMIVGYECQGFSSNGKPILALKLASREPGYGMGEAMVGRP